MCDPSLNTHSRSRVAAHSSVCRWFSFLTLCSHIHASIHTPLHHLPLILNTPTVSHALSQVNKMHASAMNLDQQVMALEGAAQNVDIMDAMTAGRDEFKNIAKKM